MEKLLQFIIERLANLESAIKVLKDNLSVNDNSAFESINSNTQHITETEEAMCETYEEQTMTNLEVQEALVELYEMIES